jgi:hypothetical protein
VDIYFFLVCGTNFGFCVPMPAPAPICAAAGDMGRAGFAAGLPITFATGDLRIIAFFTDILLTGANDQKANASVRQTPASSL